MPRGRVDFGRLASTAGQLASTAGQLASTAGQLASTAGQLRGVGAIAVAATAWSRPSEEPDR